MQVIETAALVIHGLTLAGLGWWRLAVLTEKVDQVEQRLNGSKKSVPSRCHAHSDKLERIEENISEIKNDQKQHLQDNHE